MFLDCPSSGLSFERLVLFSGPIGVQAVLASTQQNIFNSHLISQSVPSLLSFRRGCCRTLGRIGMYCACVFQAGSVSHCTVLDSGPFVSLLHNSCKMDYVSYPYLLQVKCLIKGTEVEVSGMQLFSPRAQSLAACLDFYFQNSTVSCQECLLPLIDG